MAVTRIPRAGVVGLFVLLFSISCSDDDDWSENAAPPTDLEFAVSFSEALSAEAQDGRVILVVSKQTEGEPRFQVAPGPTGQQVFGIDVDGLAPGAAAVIDDDVMGFPMEGLGLIPPGEYTVQAVLNRYETFVRSDGHTVKLPPDQGEGQICQALDRPLLRSLHHRKPGSLWQI